MSTVQVFERNAFKVEWTKSDDFGPATYQLIGPDNYRRSYGTDEKAAIKACKRKGGAAKLEFTGSFTGTVYEGETLILEHAGFAITAKIWADDDTTPPWEREDGHGPVSDWVYRDKAPGELLLNTRRGTGATYRYYDFAKACRIARADGWDSKPYNTGQETKRQQAAKAARADFERLRAWCADDWQYIGVALQVSRAGVDLTGEYGAALWGIESDCADYITQVANELLPDALQIARAKLTELKAI
jgi:hypothetical protein